MERIDPELEKCLGARRFGLVRMWLRLVGGNPYWEECDDGTVCLTWSKGLRDVVLLVKDSGEPVLYRDGSKLVPATSEALSSAVRWMRDGVEVAV